MYKLDKSYCAIVKHIAAEKGFSNCTQVGVVNPEQKHLKLDVSSGVCRVNQIQMLFKDLLTNPKAHEIGEVI